jgi:hypothetical protein
MSRFPTVRIQKGNNIPAILIVTTLPLGSMAFAQQDRFTLQVPNGLAFSEIRGYETWQDVAVSQTEASLKAIVANDVMISAFREGVPGNGKPCSRRIQDREDRVVPKESRVSLFRDGAGHAENGCVHREGFHEIPEHARMGICPVCL